MNYLLGIIEDNVTIIYFGKYLRLYGADFVNKLTQPFPVIFDIEKGTEYPFFAIYFALSKIIDTFVIYNIFVLVSLVLTGVFFYIFLSNFLCTRLVKTFLTIVFLISPYFAYHYESHPTLLFLWLLIICINILVKPTAKRTLFFSFAVLLLSVVSNYLAYFAWIFYTLYVFCHILVELFYRHGFSINSTQAIKYYLANLSIFLLIALAVFGPKLVNSTGNNDLSSYSIPIRPLEDFFTFTSRPWYFVLPSVDNPFYGDITYSLIEFLQNDWGYYLTTNYFKSEHSTSYMGLVNIGIGFFGLYTVVHYKNKETKKNSLIALFATSIFIAILTLPPYIVIGGVRFFMPSYLAYIIFPMFRVLVRLGIVNLLILLVFTGIGYEYLVEFLTSKSSKKMYLGYSLLILLAFLSLSEFWMPVRITHQGLPPAVFSKLGELPNNGSLAIYPENMSQSALVWHWIHKKPAVHLRVRMDTPQGHDGEKLIKELNTDNGLQRAKSLGVKYLIVFNGKKNSSFSRSTQLQEIATFPKEDVKPSVLDKFAWLIRVEEIGPKDKATLYILK